MGLSRDLSPETETLEDELEDASEEEMEADSADPWTSDGPLGDMFLCRASPALLLLFQDSGVSSFCPVSTLASWAVLLGLELVLVRAARASR